MRMCMYVCMCICMYVCRWIVCTCSYIHLVLYACVSVCAYAIVIMHARTNKTANMNFCYGRRKKKLDRLFIRQSSQLCRVSFVSTLHAHIVGVIRCRCCLNQDQQAMQVTPVPRPTFLEFAKSQNPNTTKAEAPEHLKL